MPEAELHEPALGYRLYPQIQLAWGQKVAAYWSIYWPNGLVLFMVTMTLLLIARHNSIDLIKSRTGRSIIAYPLGFVLQAILTRRLVVKNYRTFFLAVIRDHAQPSRRFSVSEAWLVWLQIMWPSLILWLFQYYLYSLKLQGGWLTLTIFLLDILLLGPYITGRAINLKYPGFHLQAYTPSRCAQGSA